MAQNAILRWICKLACEKFGGDNDGVFNSACFASAMAQVLNVENVIDGRLVKLLLLDCDFVVPLPGGAHWKMMSLYRCVSLPTSKRDLPNLGQAMKELRQK